MYDKIESKTIGFDIVKLIKIERVFSVNQRSILFEIELE